MSRRGLLILGAIILVPFFIAGFVRMGCKAARRGGFSSSSVHGDAARLAAPPPVVRWVEVA